VRLPAGYVDCDRGDFRVIATRLELDEMVALLTSPERDRPSTEPACGGRGWARRLVLPGGKAVYVRKYVRGGAARRLVHDRFVLRPERPLRELVVTEAARAAGCPVPHVLAIAIEEAGIGYRGWIVTEAIDGVRPLIDAYVECSGPARAALLAGVGAAMRRLHAAGVYHVDLTGHNVLVGPGDRVVFVDFDRAFLGPPASERHVRAGTRRFWRSMEKLARRRRLALEPTTREWLAAGYGG
jgi:aminoglycoside phosphotransferase (APT) family kinase protein